MNIWKGLLVAGCLLFAVPSLGQTDTGPDGIGIYFDLTATQNSANAIPGEAVTAYLIATNPTQAGGLALWEAVVHTPATQVMIWGGVANGSNLAPNMPPGGPTFSFLVTPNDPLPALQEITLLATLSITVLESDPVGLEVHGMSYGLPFYRVDDPFGLDHALHPSSGNANLPVAMINGEAPVPAEVQPWGQVKSLYR